MEKQNHPYSYAFIVGEGTYGVVWKAKDTEKNTYIAIKKIKPDTSNSTEGVPITACREISVMRELEHENILNLQDIYLDMKDHTISLVLEWSEYDFKEILKVFKTSNLKTTPLLVKSLMWQLMNGINYLHDNWVIHRDLKPSNLLITKSGKVKIADFGLARIFKSPVTPLFDNGVVVTVWYRSIELLLGSKHYTPAIDIWAIGAIFSEIITTKPLFPGNEQNSTTLQKDQIDKICHICGRPNPIQWPTLLQMQHWNAFDVSIYPEHSRLNKMYQKYPVLTNNAFDLLEKFLIYDPNKRITAKEALQHPYFSDDPKPSNNVFADTRNIIFPDRVSLIKGNMNK